MKSATAGPENKIGESRGPRSSSPKGGMIRQAPRSGMADIENELNELRAREKKRAA